MKKEKVRILAVDDRPENLLTLRAILGPQEYELVEAGSGKEGLSLLLKHDFAMILLDVQMPEMDGFETAQLIRKREKTRLIPILFLSAAHKDMQNISKGYSLGAIDYIVKPFDPVMLSSKVRILADLYQTRRQLQKHVRLLEESETQLEKLVRERTLQLEEANRDLTEEIAIRKRTEDELKSYSQNLERMVEERTKDLDSALKDAESERAHLGSILKSVADGLIVTDMSNNLILMNPVAEAQLRADFSAVSNRSISFAINDSTLRDRLDVALNRREVGYQFDFTLPTSTKENPIILQARTAPVRDPKGRRIGTVTIFHDVTKERELDRMKTGFLSTAAHELRSPLTSIRGFSEILLTRENIPAKEQRRFMEHISKQAVNLTNIINDLLDISRIESGKGFSLSKTAFDLCDLIRQKTALYESSATTHRFSLILSDGPVEVVADRDKMDQALENIFSNAVKYSPEGGDIRVSANNQQKSVLVVVEDHGIGMTPEQVRRMFDKFWRADSSNTAIEGTGLGMSIVKYIVEAHGGNVWVESKPGEGTKVCFNIPLK
jgi:PAS domain S-box-containing protein